MLLKLSVEETLVLEVRNSIVTPVLWTNLQNKYQASEVGWSLYFKNLLFSTKLREGGSVSKYLLYLKDLNDQFFAIKKLVDDEDMVALLMRSLSPSFDSFVESLHLLGENQQLTFEKLLTLFCIEGKEARSNRSINSIHYNECI